MSQPCSLLTMESDLCLISTDEPQASAAGPSIEKPATHHNLDEDFDFQIVVFKVYFLFFNHKKGLITKRLFFFKKNKDREYAF